MSDLKTLKDLREYLHSFDDGEKHIYVRKDDLKQEAIKWVKYFYKRHHGFWTEERCVGAIRALMDFHNITEDDLK